MYKAYYTARVHLSKDGVGNKELSGFYFPARDHAKCMLEVGIKSAWKSYI